MQRFHPFCVPQLHRQTSVIHHGVAGKVEVLVLAVDGVVGPHLVQAGRVQVGLDLHQLLVVQLTCHLSSRQLISGEFVFFLKTPALCLLSFYRKADILIPITLISGWIAEI